MEANMSLTAHFRSTVHAGERQLPGFWVTGGDPNQPGDSHESASGRRDLHRDLKIGRLSFCFEGPVFPIPAIYDHGP